MHICFLFVGLRVPEKIKSSSPLNLATVNEYSESKVKNNQWTSKGQWHSISVKRKETLSELQRGGGGRKANIEILLVSTGKKLVVSKLND